MLFTWLAVVGLIEPSSFMTMCITAWPRSPNTVGHGVSVVHGDGDVTFVMTSEVSVVAGVPMVAAPRMPASESITRYDDARPVRTTSPHETDTATIATSKEIRVRRCIRVILCSSALDDARRDEDQQLRALVVQR